MDFNSTIDLIIKDLDEARQIIDDLKSYPGVPALQVELAKSKCKSAGEVIALLKSLSNNFESVCEQIQPEKKAASTLPDSSSLIHEAKQKKKADANNPFTYQEKGEEKMTFILSSPNEEENSGTDATKIVPPLSEKKEVPKKSHKKITEPHTIADKFAYLPDSFNEHIGSMKNEADLSDILETKPLASISDAIGINDKFLYLREIFNSNNDTYTQAISRLDNARNMSDAKAIITSYISDNPENEAAKQLLSLVKRKLRSDE